MKCFVISPIGESGTEIRAQSDDFLEYIVKEALCSIGYDVERADTITESGLITSQIIERITSADLIVADLSRHNANVFYELAIRHVTGKPFVQLIERREKIPFDVANSRTIQYSLDLHGARKAREELVMQVKSILSGNSSIENPISVAVDLNALASSEDPVKAALLRIENELTAIKSSLDKIFFPNIATQEPYDPIDTSIYENKGSVRDLVRRMAASDFKNHLEIIPVPVGWNDENVAVLKAMWDAGASASQIGKALGVSRNAVIGKIHRLGLYSNRDDDAGST